MSDYKAVVIGGSAGSFAVVLKMLSQLRADFELPIIICMHRLKHIRSGLVESLNVKSQKEVIEPFDKQRIEQGKVYLAPSNYHMFIEFDGTISLSVEDMNNQSRPSIDYTLSSAAVAYREKCLGIILTGANKDGAKGLKDIADKKGFTIVQDPKTADVPTMPKAALEIMKPDLILTPDQITDYLNKL
ncbi:MAG: chemotaxis protein CheB [Marinilabiliaceae bacterium]|nr:chemotaxis protein CheB [Marinilabiliaceae bacterium]